MQYLDRPVVCPVLIGRAPHFEVLERYLNQAIENRGQALLLAGEAGVGKSRFVAEARERAALLGMTVLEGRCFESHRSLPYAPLIDLLRSAVPGAQPAQLAEAIGPAASELARILPELTPLFRDKTSAEGTEQSEQEKHQLFRALSDAVRALAADRPALMIVEDTHWSDDASLDFLEGLARQNAMLPILILVTYRDDEISTTLSKLLAELDRQRLAVELRLARLGRAEVDEMLRAIWGLERPVRPDFLEAIFSLTDGNPFFIEEVLRSLISTGDVVVSTTDGVWDYRPIGQLRVPRSVRDAVERRTAQLSDAGRYSLQLAAVVGQRFDIELLKELMGVDEAELLQSIKETLAAGLLIEESADRFAFRHALTREAVRAGLLARELKTLHQSIAEAIERVHGAPPSSLEASFADLAYHFHEAEVWDKVLLYAPRAGDQAQALYAPRAAVEHFTRALQAAQRLGHEPPLKLLGARGQAYETLGEFEAARADFEAVLEQARAAGDKNMEWQALLNIGAVWVGHSYERAGGYYRTALDLARESGGGNPRQLAHTLNRGGNWHMNLEEPTQAVAYHREALTFFQDLNDRGGVAETLDHLGMASFLAGDLINAREHFERAIPLLRELDQRNRLISALATLAISGEGGAMWGDLMVLPSNEVGASQRHAEEAARIARDIGWRAGQAYALNCLAGVFLTTGRVTRAVDSAEAALRIAEELEHSEWMVHALCSLGALYLDVTALSTARAHYDRAVRLAVKSESRYWIRFSSAPAALVCVAQGDWSRAETLLDGLIDLSRPAQTWAERAIWYAHARMAHARGDHATALRLTDELIACDAHATRDRPIRRLAYLRGQALAALGRLAEAEDALQRALRSANEHGTGLLIWRIQADLGWVQWRQGRRREAEVAFAEVRSIVEGLLPDMPPDLRPDFLRSATDSLPQPRGRTPRQVAKEASGGLTAREFDVATLVSRGMSNREIADALVLGERTVQTHVGHILGKLGFSSRAQIAAWAAERGLASDQETDTEKR